MHVSLTFPQALTDVSRSAMTRGSGPEHSNTRRGWIRVGPEDLVPASGTRRRNFGPSVLGLVSTSDTQPGRFGGVLGTLLNVAASNGAAGPAHSAPCWMAGGDDTTAAVAAPASTLITQRETACWKRPGVVASLPRVNASYDDSDLGAGVGDFVE